MAAAWTGVGVENRAAVSRSFSEGDIDSSEKLCILLSCWPELRNHCTNLWVVAAISVASLLFKITLKTNGGNGGRVFSESIH